MAKKETSDRISSIAARYSKHPDHNVRSMSMSLLGQDETKGPRRGLLTPRQSPLPKPPTFVGSPPLQQIGIVGDVLRSIKRSQRKTAQRNTLLTSLIAKKF